MSTFEEYLAAQNTAKHAQGLNRTLKCRSTSASVDFSSNDYLGLSKNQTLIASIVKRWSIESVSLGATGSRLITGENQEIHNLELEVAKFHNVEAALVFSSGYAANIGFWSCVPHRNDFVIFDSAIHASIKDGIRLGQARSTSFLHNDIDSLRHRLNESKGRVYISIESLYSMDGDFSPLAEIIEVASEYDAAIIVDEAHSTGVFGKNGEGWVAAQGLESKVAARVVTFGKGVGVQGAAVLGSNQLKQFLINNARSFLYSTGMSPLAVEALHQSFRLLPSLVEERKNIFDRVRFFRDCAIKNGIELFSAEHSPIQSIIIPGVENARNTASFLQDNGYDVRAILSPTVAAGKERLRFTIHSFNTENEIEGVLKLLSSSRPFSPVS